MHAGRPTSVSEVSGLGNGSFDPLVAFQQQGSQTDTDIDIENIGRAVFTALDTLSQNPDAQKGFQGLENCDFKPYFTPEGLQQLGPDINAASNFGKFFTPFPFKIPGAPSLTGSTPLKSTGPADKPIHPTSTLETPPSYTGTYAGESTGAQTSLPGGINLIQYAPIALGLSLTIGFAVMAFKEANKSPEKKKMSPPGSSLGSPRGFAAARMPQRHAESSNPSGWAVAAYSVAAAASLGFTGLYCKFNA